MSTVAQASVPIATTSPHERAWRGFKPGPWQSRINLRDFVQRNYAPYEGDASFLTGSTERTRAVWETLTPLLAREREKGVLDVS
jgi:formate C-acetyltransferase